MKDGGSLSLDGRASMMVSKASFSSARTGKVAPPLDFIFQRHAVGGNGFAHALSLRRSSNLPYVGADEVLFVNGFLEKALDGGV